MQDESFWRWALIKHLLCHRDRSMSPRTMFIALWPIVPGLPAIKLPTNHGGN